MPESDEILQLLRDMRASATGKKDTAWIGIAIGVLSGLLSFWASNAVMGERVSRLQVDVSEDHRTQVTLHGRVEKVDRDHDKSISALYSTIGVQQAQMLEMQQTLKDLWNKSKIHEGRDPQK